MENEYNKLSSEEVIEYYNNTLDEIKEIIQRIPPSYAYGDNEAGCYMANMLEEINYIIINASNLVANLHKM
jgi:hypothetical protein